MQRTGPNPTHSQLLVDNVGVERLAFLLLSPRTTPLFHFFLVTKICFLSINPFSNICVAVKTNFQLFDAIVKFRSHCVQEIFRAKFEPVRKYSLPSVNHVKIFHEKNRPKGTRTAQNKPGCQLQLSISDKNWQKWIFFTFLQRAQSGFCGCAADFYARVV